MSAGNVSDSVSHGEDRQAEGESNAKQTDTHIRERGSQNYAAATTKDKPESAKEFSRQFIKHGKALNEKLVGICRITGAKISPFVELQQ